MLLKSATLEACGVCSHIEVLLSKPSKLSDRSTKLLPKNEAGIIYFLFHDENLAQTEIFLEYKCTSGKQHQSILLLFSVWWMFQLREM